MPTYTMKIESVCAGGEHIRLGIYADGVKQGTMNLLRSEVVADKKTTWADVVPFLCRKAVASANATRPAQRKAAIESLRVVLP